MTEGPENVGKGIKTLVTCVSIVSKLEKVTGRVRRSSRHGNAKQQLR